MQDSKNFRQNQIENHPFCSIFDVLQFSSFSASFFEMKSLSCTHYQI